MMSHGYSVTERMFCACCRSTPQLTAGGRIPMPRKLSAVSPSIICGMASVMLTIR